MKTFLLASALLGLVSARCPNGCSNQGLCGPNSQCKCYRNFQGSDCSERVCYYALSFVDTPAGDLNADGAIGMTLTFEEGSQDYATEGYPLNYGVARPVDGSSESGRWDEGHFYRQCPQGPDPVAHSDKVTTSLQKIAFGAFSYQNEFLQGEDSFDKVLSGPVYFTVTVTDDYGDEWTTNTLSIHYITTCHTGVTDIDCRSKPVFNPATTGCPVTGDPATADKSSTYDSTDYACARNYGYMEENNAAGFDWYAKNTIADDLNVSLQGLPNGAVKEPYVWMWYTDKSNNLEPTPDVDHPTADDVHLAEESKNPTAPDLDDEKKTALQNELYVFNEANKAVADSGIS